jgi:hypothetical protein
MRSRVFVSVASVPERERGLATVVEALYPQADVLAVYLNGYRRIPKFLHRPGILVAQSRLDGDRGDAGKFFWSDRVRGYHLTCDDDVLYPPNYVSSLVEGIEAYGLRAVVGFHGVVLNDTITDYHRSRTLRPYYRELGGDTPVHLLGTGVCGYHTSAITVQPSDFPLRNMADVWFALLGQRQEVPFLCLGHRAGWLRPQARFQTPSIYTRSVSTSGHISKQTVVMQQQQPWRLFDLPVAADTMNPSP